MYLVGLTGGIASGKSSVARRFVQRGAELVDADQIARDIVEPGTETWKKLIEHFGDEILDLDGTINRPVLGRIVFNDPQKRALLNELTHPPVAAQIADRLEALTPLDGLVVLDVPLLVEAGVGRGYEAIVVVASHPETQVERLTRLRGYDEDEAWARVRAQAPVQDKLAIATHIVWNEGTVQELQAQTDAIIDELEAAARAKAERRHGAVPND